MFETRRLISIGDTVITDEYNEGVVTGVIYVSAFELEYIIEFPSGKTAILKLENIKFSSSGKKKNRDSKCTCGSKHTSNSKFHYKWCDLERRN